MARLAVFLLACAVSFGQPPQPDPIDAATQEYHQAHNRGDFEAAAAKREEARKLLGQAPVDSQRFAGWVSNVTGLYRSAGRTAQARGILEETLKRADGVPAVRIQILQQLGDAWVQDGNLVRAVGYWEKAVEAVEKTPPPNEPAQPVRFANRVGVFSYIGQAPMGVNSYPYQRLAGLYRELGRTEAAAQIFEKMRAKLQDNPQALASAYQQEGDLDQALEIYKKQLERATEQQPRLQAIQAIANLYQQEARFADAAAMLAQAGPHAPVYLRLQLGQLQQQAGLTQAADQTYQAAMTEFGPAQVIQQYANHLNQTNRAGQAEEILKSYVASASLEDGQQSSLYYALANSARIAGHQDRASEYQRVATSRQVRHSEPNQIGADLNQAQTMINQGFVEDAFRPAMGTIETVRDNGAWQVGNIANQLGSHKAPEKGDQLFRA